MNKVRMTILGILLIIVTVVSVVIDEPIKTQLIDSEEYVSKPVVVPYLNRTIQEEQERIEYVQERKAVAENESVSTVDSRFNGKTVIASGRYDGLTREDRITEQRTIRYSDGCNGNRPRYSEDSADVGNIIEVNNESTVQEESTEFDTGGMEGTEDPESVPELVESESISGVEAGFNNIGDEGFDSEIDAQDSDWTAGLTYLGDWTITAYCPCEVCCGQWATGYTASGNPAISGHTIACNSLPFYSKVMIDGIEYTVEDTGSTEYGDAWIDIFFDTHEEALAYGVQTREVYLVE